MRNSRDQQDFLAQTIAGFQSLPADQDRYGYLAQRFAALAKGALAVAGSYDAGSGTLTCRAVAGDDPLVARLPEILGQSVVGAEARLPADAFAALSLGRVTKVPIKLSELVPADIPAVAVEAVERALDLGDRYAAGFVCDGRLLGSVLLLLGRDTKDIPEELAQALVDLSAVVLARRAAEQELVRCEARYHRLFDGNPVAVLRADLETGRIVACNAAFAALTGFEDPAAVLEAGFGVYDLYDRQRRNELLSMARLRGAGLPGVELTCRRRDGSEFAALASGQIVEDDGSTEASILDITHLKLAHQHALLQASLLDQVRNVVICLDPEGRITYVNWHGESVFGWTEGDVSGKDLIEVVAAPAFKGLLHGILDVVRRGGHWSGEMLAVRKSGAVFPLQVSLSLVKDEGGTPISIALVGSDATENRASEARLARRQLALEAVFRMASDTRHGLEELCRQLVYDLGHVLGVQHVRVMRLTAGGAEIVAQLCRAETSGRTPFDIVGTPAEVVVQQNGTCMFARGLREQFPKCKYLYDYNINTFMGASIADADGTPVGVLAVLDEERLLDEEEIALVEMFAAYLGREFAARA